MSELQAELVDDAYRITLPGVLDIPAAADLREKILETVVPGMNVTIQCESVEQVTTPGLQVLMAVASHVDDQKARLTIAAPSDTLIDGFSDLGLFSQLMAWNIE